MPNENWSDPQGIDKAQAATEAAAETAAQAATDQAIFDNGNSGAAKTISVANGKHQKIVLTASAPTLTLVGFTSGSYEEILLYVVQDATGSRLLPTFSPAATWGAAGAPTLSTAAAAVDIIKLSDFNGGNVDAVLVEKGA